MLVFAGSVRDERIRFPIPLVVLVRPRGLDLEIYWRERVAHRDLKEPLGWRSSSFRNILLQLVSIQF